MKKTLQEEKRERYLKNLINEAIINILAEQEQIQGTEEQVPITPAPTVDSTANTMSTPPVPDASTADAGQQETEEFTVDTMVKKLNVLRGGKSLKDPEVFGQLTTFFNNLTDEQKNSLQWLLDELTKVVAVPQQNVPQPTGTGTPMPEQVPPNPAPAPTSEPTQITPVV